MAVYSISFAYEIAGFSDPCKSSLVKQLKKGVIRKMSKSTVYMRSQIKKRVNSDYDLF